MKHIIVVHFNYTVTSYISSFSTPSLNIDVGTSYEVMVSSFATQ